MTVSPNLLSRNSNSWRIPTRGSSNTVPHPTLTSHTHILSSPETKITTLPNGLRVATESNLAVKTATVGVWIDAGSRFETDETNGTAHFLEHMIFKGTVRRTARIWRRRSRMGGHGHLNAYTSREQTTYYAKVLDKDVNNALDILADILQNSKFEKSRISRESDVILRERRRGGGQWSCLIGFVGDIRVWGYLAGLLVLGVDGIFVIIIHPELLLMVMVPVTLGTDPDF
ncbi:probable mitochondrial-processing peptidase subunit beta, mitochondrial [Mangifera indica]|uniref:probable mitochondrial-processing peptidase subunit beta, mitochondrial n=1 Tax=Mangifera indica TaxID=29780 RepID=UPI001CF9C80D|nr:probable mitochondrial-processing peptidase subunit beta, mitochondrial [Mangifera indica]